MVLTGFYRMPRNISNFELSSVCGQCLTSQLHVIDLKFLHFHWLFSVFFSRCLEKRLNSSSISNAIRKLCETMLHFGNKSFSLLNVNVNGMHSSRSSKQLRQLLTTLFNKTTYINNKTKQLLSNNSGGRIIKSIVKWMDGEYRSYRTKMCVFIHLLFDNMAGSN